MQLNAKNICQNSLWATAMLVALLMVGIGVPRSAMAQDDSSSRTQPATELEKKVQDLQGRFAELGTRLEQATGETASNLKAEFENVAKELADVLAERRDTFQQHASEVKTALDKAWKKWEVQSEQARELTAAEIETIRSRWNMAYINLQKAHYEHVNHISRELDRMEKEIAATSNEVSYEVAAKREAVRLAYEQRASEMRDSYRDYIKALQNEVERITVAAEGASVENRARMMKKVDEINAKSNAAYEKVHHNFDRIAAKARAYLQRNRERLVEADDQVSEKIQSEMDAMTSDVTRLRAEMVESMEAYHDSLNQQSAQLEKRVAAGGAEVTAMAAMLDARRKQAESQLVDAYRSYAMSIENEVKRLQDRLERVDDNARSEIDEAIDVLQSELARIQDKLQ